jgi:Icc-related predicted phosphoesterase
MKVCCISDTHEYHRSIDLPDADVLVHAGDCTMMGDDYWLRDFNAWLGERPHAHKIVVFGNHELTCDPKHRGFKQGHSELITNATVLNDSGVEIEGVKFWGSPVQPEFCDWAFNVARGPAIKKHWDLIPSDTDVLITHGPPFGVLDSAKPGSESCGCHDLANAIERVKPKLSIFGHIHGGYGISERDGTTYVNASTVNERYRPTNAPIVLAVEGAD